MDVKAQRSISKRVLKPQEIINALAARDQHIQERVYVHYWGYLMGVATRYVKDGDTAREIVNDSFIKAFKSMYDFKHNGLADDFQKAFRAWLAKITVRTALDRIRINKSPLDFVESYDHIAVDHVQMQDDLHVADIMKLIYQLPDLQRTIFNMYEIEGFSHEEISKALDIPTSTSRTYLTRAKQKLRELYTKMIQVADGKSR